MDIYIGTNNTFFVFWASHSNFAPCENRWYKLKWLLSSIEICYIDKTEAWRRHMRISNGENNQKVNMQINASARKKYVFAIARCKLAWYCRNCPVQSVYSLGSSAVTSPIWVLELWQEWNKEGSNTQTRLL